MSPKAAGMDLPEFAADLPTVQAAALLLERQLAVLITNEAGIAADSDIECLHRFRVAVRRARTLIQALKQHLPPAILGLGEDLKWLSAATGPLRDLDVHLTGFEAMISLVPDEPTSAFAPMRAVLEKRRLAAHHKALAVLRSTRYQALKRRWRRIDNIRQRTADSPLIGLAADAAIARAYAQALKKGGRITKKSPAEALHALRKDGKKLRYLMEFFAPLKQEEAIEGAIRTLKELQDCLGKHQDFAVEHAVVRKIRLQFQKDTVTPKATVAALAHLEAVLAQGQADARAHFAGLFAPFAAAKTRRLFHELYGATP